jgi:hypothetical protein
MAAAKSLAAGLPAREAGHAAYFGLLVAGDAEAALAALPAHLDAWPRDVLVLATAAFTNGLIGSSGRAGQKRMLLELLEKLAPHYGADDWWFTAHHGMALSENGQHAAARPKIDRSLVREMHTDRGACDIVEIIIALAHKMNLKIIAEGIETARQVERLRELGCEFGQGYYFSQPLESKAALQFMRQQVAPARTSGAR